MLNRSDHKMITILLNIQQHLENDYDFMCGVVGGTGDGKSRFVLDLFETWYRVILRKEVTPDMIFQVSQGYEPWVRSFKKLQPYDMSIFDESSRDLGSTDFMTKVSKNLNKLFDVFRCKRFFSIVVLPKFFRLNKALREDRLRGLFVITKRGEYKFYTRDDLFFVNALNDGSKIKNIERASCTHHNVFPDYNGVLLEPYLEQKNDGVDEVLNEVINDIAGDRVKKKSPYLLYKDKILELRTQGKSFRAISTETELPLATVHKIWTMYETHAELDE